METEVAGANVDQKLVSLALEMQARVMTNDYNLQQVCALRGVEVINLNEVAKALRPVIRLTRNAPPATRNPQPATRNQ